MPKPKLLVDQLELLLSTGNGADVHFLVGEDEEKEQIAAHKTLLMAASDVFEAMFAYDSQNGTMAGNSPSNPVVVTDICAVPFKAMLRFIYTNKLSVLDGQNAMAVFYAAKKYAIIGLIEGSDDFLPIDQQSFCEILSRDQFKVGEEIFIWQAALRWADERCRQNGIECSGDNRRKMLGPILMTIRFPLMAQDEFLKIIVPSKMLTVDEMFPVLLSYSHSVATECGAFDHFPLRFSNQRRILTKASDSPSPTGRRLILKIYEFSKILKIRSIRSNTVKIKGFSWNLTAIPEEKQDGIHQLSFSLQLNWNLCELESSCYCLATLRIVSQKQDKADHIQTKRHLFQKKPSIVNESTLFCKMPFKDLMSSENGWHNEVKDILTVTVDVTVENAETQPSVDNKLDKLKNRSETQL
ncbi:hypothetical protein niasHT_024943 [Heterodera trifolii]|uniref:BTB domain-containing protein n=1 Tax=Heterodera trifolii TaxID=157864 RepID=A0ABD2JAB0_9BILA